MAIKGMSEDIVNALQFDPFEAINDGGSDGGTPNDGQGTPAARQPGTENQGGEKPINLRGERGRFTKDATRVPPVARVPASQPAQVPPQVPAQTSPQGAAPVPQDGQRVNEVAELMGRLKEVPAFAAPSQPAQQQPQQRGAGPRTGYDYSKPWAEQQVNLPPQLLDAIFNEDRNVAATGMAVLVNTMYNSLMSDMHARVAEVLHAVPQLGEQQTEMAVARNQLKTKFYGRFPELGDQVGMQTVYSLATNIANMYQQTGQQFDPMSDDFIEYVGEQALRVLNRQGQQRSPRRQFSTGGATREGGGGANPFMESIGMA